MVWIVMSLMTLVSVVLMVMAYRKVRQPAPRASKLEKHEIPGEYLLEVAERLRSSGFTVAYNVRYKNQTFAQVAKRTAFEYEKGGFTETFFLFTEFHTIDLTALRDYSKICFAYAKRKSRVPLPRGFFHTVVCYSVALSHGVDSATADAVRNMDPPLHWAACEFPVICDLDTRRLYYFEKTPAWGSMYWDHFRNTVVSLLSP